MNSVHPSYPSRDQRKINKNTHNYNTNRGVKQASHQYGGSRQSMGRGGRGAAGNGAVVVTRHGVAREARPDHSGYPDNVRAIVLSCVVTWFFCVILGIVAFVYASKWNFDF